jgi:hypothetical protein
VNFSDTVWLHSFVEQETKKQTRVWLNVRTEHAALTEISDFHGCKHLNCTIGCEVLTAVLMQHNVMYSVASQRTFRRNISPPSSRSNNKTSKNQSESRWQASVHFQRTTRRYISEDGTLNLNSRFLGYVPV